MFSCLAYIAVSVIFGLLETNNEKNKRELDIKKKKKKKTCRITTKNTTNRRMSTVPITVDTRPDGCVFYWPRGHMRHRNNWPRV
jgi:hypothetical protein